MNPKTPTRLATNLEKRLLAYAASASITAIVSSLPAGAEIVYTPTNQPIYFGYDSYNLDLNHDGVIDFEFAHIFTCTTFCESYVDVFGAVNSNQPIGGGPPSSYASALRRGALIGSNRKFEPFGRMAYAISYLGSVEWRGPWANGGKGVKNRYLGLKFQIGNETHYGWARLNVTTSFSGFTPVLTGYAYETEADRPIEAGVLPVSNPDTAFVPESDASAPWREKSFRMPATLGMLANGVVR